MKAAEARARKGDIKMTTGPKVKPAIERRWNYKGFEKSQRGLDLSKHQSYLAIHLALCDNTKPHTHPAAEGYFAEALDDARLAGMELEHARISGPALPVVASIMRLFKHQAVIEIPEAASLLVSDELRELRQMLTEKRP